MVLWLNDRNADFPKVPKGSCLFLRRRDKDGNLDRVLSLYGWSAHWQPAVLHAVRGKASGQLFALLPD